MRFQEKLAQHELRYGVDAEINGYDANVGETWYRFFGPRFGAGAYVQERIYSVVGKGSTTNTAMFVQDAWNVTPSLQLNLGLRYEIQKLDSANDVAVAGESDAIACTVDLECRTVKGLDLDGNWAPRLGLSWDPLQNGRSKIYGFRGRFYEAIPLDMNIRSINGERYIITQYLNQAALTQNTWYNPSGSPLALHGPWSVRRVSTLVNITPLDENLKSQYEDQL